MSRVSRPAQTCQHSCRVHISCCAQISHFRTITLSRPCHSLNIFNNKLSKGHKILCPLIITFSIMVVTLFDIYFQEGFINLTYFVANMWAAGLWEKNVSVSFLSSRHIEWVQGLSPNCISMMVVTSLTLTMSAKLLHSQFAQYMY